MTGDFSLLWCTRSGANLLVTIGLRLSGVLGLRSEQLALLSYAGCRDAAEVVPSISNNASTLFAQTTNQQKRISASAEGNANRQPEPVRETDEKATVSTNNTADAKPSVMTFKNYYVSKAGRFNSHTKIFYNQSGLFQEDTTIVNTLRSRAHKKPGGASDQTIKRFGL